MLTTTEAKLQARIFTKDLTDEEIDALAAVAVAGELCPASCCLQKPAFGTASCSL
jgi:hypothetical protein